MKSPLIPSSCAAALITFGSMSGAQQAVILVRHAELQGAAMAPAEDLAPLTTYTATISTGASDLAGNALASERSWSFTTGTIPDATAPTVYATIPGNGATGVGTSSQIAGTFSEPMDASTINTTTFTLKQGTTPVAGTVIYNGVTATFTPAEDLVHEVRGG